MSTDPFERFFKKHGRPVRKVLGDEYQRIEVAIHSGYIEIRTTRPGSSPYVSQVYLSRRDAVTLVKWLVPLLRKMDPAKEHNVPRAMAEYLQTLDYLEQSQRQLSQDRRRGRRRSRRRPG